MQVSMSILSVWYEWVPSWISSVGTILTVIVALFGKVIHDCLTRPKITMVCPLNSELCKEVKESKSSNDGASEIRIRVLLKNGGKRAANDSSLYVDCVYTKRDADESYVKKEYTPIQLKDYQAMRLDKILPNLNYYVDVISIARYDEMTESGEESKSKQFYKVALLGDGRKEYLGKGTFLIPLKFYSSSATHDAYLKIYWSSDTLKDDPRTLDYRLLSKKEFENLVK